MTEQQSNLCMQIARYFRMLSKADKVTYKETDNITEYLKSTKYYLEGMPTKDEWIKLHLNEIEEKMFDIVKEVITIEK